MSRRVPLVRNQATSGSVLLITLMVLLAVTILGIMSISISTVELKIGRNEREIRETFYLAEGAVMEGVQRLMNTSAIDLNEQFQSWHHAKADMAQNKIDFRETSQWVVEGSDKDNGLKSALDDHTYLAAVEWQVAGGGSLIQTQSRLYQNRIYGLSKKYNNDNLVEVGFCLRY